MSVKDAGSSSGKKTKPVGTVEATKPTQSNGETVQAQANAPEKEVSPPSSQPSTPAQPQPEPFVLIEVPKLTKGQIATAKMAGFPLDKLFEGLNRINQFANMVVERDKEYQAMFQKMGLAFNRLEPLVKLAETMPKTSGGSGPVAESGQAGNILSILEKALSSPEPKPNPMAEKAMALMNTLLDRAIAAVTEKSSFEKYFDEELAKAKAKAMAAQLVS